MTWEEIEPILDEELDRMSERHRAPLVLCYLEGTTRDEAARQLGWSVRTLMRRLEEGRALLRRRLTRRGVSLGAALITTGLSSDASSAGVLVTLLGSTLKAVSAIAEGNAGAAVVSAKVVALSDGVVKAMFTAKLKTAGFVTLVVAALGLGAGRLLPSVAEWRSAGPATVFLSPGLPPRAGPPRVLVEHQSPVLCLGWSADGRQLAAGTQDGTVHVTDATTGKDRSFPTQPSAVTALAFSPDGKVLEVFNQFLRQSTWDAGTGKQYGGHAQYDHAVDHLAFLAGGRWVVGVAEGAFVKRQFVTSGPAEGLGRAGATATSAPSRAAIAPDGTVSGYCDTKGLLVVLQSGPVDKFNFGDDATLHVGEARSIAFGPGGKLLAVGGEKAVQLWDWPAKKKTHALTGLDQPAARLAISANGGALAALGADGTTVLVWDLKGNSVRCRIIHNRGVVGSLALSPDGKVLATTVKDGKAVFLWKAEPRVLTRQVPPLELSAKELAALWGDLSGPDHAKSDAAWHKLGAAGDNAIPFLRLRIRAYAVAAADLKQIEKQVAQLDSNEFATREQASKELEAAGELAVVPLKRMLATAPSVEARRRAERLLKKVAAQEAPPPEMLRVLDAIDLLAQVRTAKAIALLGEIQREARVAQVRIEAKRAMQAIGRTKDNN